MKLKRFFTKIDTVLINLGLILFILLISSSAVFVDINNFVLDKLQGQLASRSDIMIVQIDDQSLQAIGAWPWNRDIFAKAVQNIANQKPSVIGFDILFLENREGDTNFQKVISESQVPIVMGSKLVESTTLESIYTNTQSGFVNFNQDEDGKIRRTKAYSTTSDACELSLSLKLVSEYLHISDTKPLCENKIQIRNNTYQTDSENQLNFQYSKQDFDSISFDKVLNGDFEEGFFKNKIVLIGSTALDVRSNLNDNFEDIFGQNIAGIKIHANIINTYLNSAFLYPINPIIAFALMLLTTSLLAYYLKWINKTRTIILIFAPLFLVFTLAGVLIFEANLLWPFIFVTLSLLGNFVFMVLYKYFTQKKEGEFIKKAFEQYMNPKLLGELIKDPTALKLGGQTKDMSVMFSDIRSFTSLSENMTPEQLIQFINDYLNHMSRIIIDNEGTIDKYIGDAIMALWNAPLNDPDHEVHAVKAALAMNQSLIKFKQENPEYPQINIGIGINTGDMVVGNVGGEKRFDYTVLGDNVNLGSRLEGLTKKYGVVIIVSESVKTGFEKKYEEDDIIFRLLDIVKVKGKDKPVEIYEPLERNPKSESRKLRYEKAFEIYKKGNFEEALRLFSKIEDDASSHKMVERIEVLIEEKQKEEEKGKSEGEGKRKDEWTGVWKWEEK